ncbi:uncharacterized protein LOC132715968 [Ruditapes philippinarum]|uniref:uncharacterized protein LOC132715968 n=1 Tax=Ruditapes philippinarum TaxID=129788 RepID=UPI00295BD133|nr:uncharacterized protein LOC132715968 [Ruditapes philippinarum]XP_060555065.1 uncharacterized protein LOC132715968 [Ruditapes philippinarum]XP_060555066.1 uncharacterized protein LOC132715968 [Ruditapes philippinarum]
MVLKFGNNFLFHNLHKPVMKSVLCFCIPFALLLTGSAQPQFNRPHPLYSGQQQYNNNNNNNNNNLLALALLFGFDFNDFLALQATRQSPGFGNLGLGPLAYGLGNFGIQRPGAQKRAQQSLNALSMLGIIDGPDLPDGPPAGVGKQGGAKRGGAKAKAAAGGEGAEGAPVKKPRRRGPRRKVKAKAANAKK